MRLENYQHVGTNGKKNEIGTTTSLFMSVYYPIAWDILFELSVAVPIKQLLTAWDCTLISPLQAGVRDANFDQNSVFCLLWGKI